MTKRLDDKIAIVTGAGTAAGGWGNGKAAAVTFARHGARVVVVDLTIELAQETADVIRSEGGEALAIAANVADSASVEQLVAETLSVYKRVDVLYNNVGISGVGDPHNVTDETWNRVMSVNMDSVRLTCRHLLPHMMKHGRGSIINVGSIASLRNLGPSYIAYPTSKAAVNQFSKILASQYGQYGIRCNTIQPGFIRTPMVEKALGPDRDHAAYFSHRTSQIPLGRMGSPWDVANAALFLASDDASYITGIDLIVDGGVTNQLV